ncbi:hypothetical protein BG006_009458 [Podila minutissima]|uniref:Uncharacterized protein n=1 Tax=Podila minutissima TaxID=64525 RepID=A0A9P5VPZ9_9FUNG|nr:hypothetical protein BG006_009458 [Podila minutissima]
MTLPTSSNSFAATMLSIPGISLPIDNVRQHIILADNGVQIGNIDTPWSASSVKGGTLTTAFTTSTLNVSSNSHAAFLSFISSLSTKASHPVTLQGAVDVKLNLGIFGRLTIPGIGFKATTPFAGLNNLDLKYVLLIDLNFDTPDMIVRATIINVKNPSKLTLKLGDVSFSTASAGNYIGVSTIKNLSLKLGDNYVLSSTALDTTKDATNAFINGLYTADGALVLSGFPGTFSNTALNAGLAAVRSNLVVPMNFIGSSMSQSHYKNWALKILPTTGTDGLVDVTATFQSPYYGYLVKMLQDEAPGEDNYAYINNVGSGVDTLRLFEFRNTLTYSVAGTGAMTVTYKANLVQFVSTDKVRLQALVAYAQQHNSIPVQFWFMARLEAGTDGVSRTIDFGNSGTGLGDLIVAVGPDFANILNFVPSA